MVGIGIAEAVGQPPKVQLIYARTTASDSHRHQRRTLRSVCGVLRVETNKNYLRKSTSQPLRLPAEPWQPIAAQNLTPRATTPTT